MGQKTQGGWRNGLLPYSLKSSIFSQAKPPKIVFVHLHKQKVLHKFYEQSLISFHFASEDQDLFLWYCCFFSRVLVYNHLQGNMLSHLTMT